MNKLLLTTVVVLGTVVLTGCSVNGDPYKSRSAESIYNSGKKAASKGNWQQAITDFDNLEAQYPYGEYTDKGNIAMVHAYYKIGDYPAALAAADRFLRVHPRHENADYVQYLKGVINYSDNYGFAFRTLPLDRAARDPSVAVHAFDDFKVLLEQFPNSKYVPDARKRMIHLRDLIARHEVAVANYYMRQGAYIAAANRAGYVVNQFPRSQPVAEGLRVLAKAYTKLDMPDVAQESYDLLKQLYPESSEKDQIF